MQRLPCHISSLLGRRSFFTSFSSKAANKLSDRSKETKLEANEKSSIGLTTARLGPGQIRKEDLVEKNHFAHFRGEQGKARAPESKAVYFLETTKVSKMADHQIGIYAKKMPDGS